MLLFEHARAFFSRFLESRNYKIQIGVQVGRKSAVVLSGIMEASYSHFFIGIDSDRSRGIFWCSIEKPRKLSPTSLQTRREWRNRTQLEEFYTFDGVIPLEVEF